MYENSRSWLPLVTWVARWTSSQWWEVRSIPHRLHALQGVSSIARASSGGGVLLSRALPGGVSLRGGAACLWGGGTGWRAPQDGALALSLSGVSPINPSISLLPSCTSLLLTLFRGVFLHAEVQQPCSASSLALFLLLRSGVRPRWPPLALATTISTALPTSRSSSPSCALPSVTTRLPITPARSSMASNASSCAASLGRS